MFVKSLVSRTVPYARRFSWTAPTVLKTGDVIRQTRVFSNQDVTEYSKVSNDLNPLHFDDEFARNAGFEDRIVHGMLVAALFPRIIASHFPGAVYVSQGLHFRSPVYIGDEIVGEVQAVSIRENKKRYIVKFSTKCFKNGELLVLDGEAMAILPNLAVEKVVD
ncbi:oxidoreductase, putative [Ricinus communis]|uniref:Oxidoreductase, putative n=2 Tax=Ricinus communis TaxID=3988 RepID=B9SK30_RICCO|nr:oxidoreductase, putative [Ricinus communis]